tara:strand:+ start:27 stop:206 length:180 start_codon:yes stop_codon:yes gene_type:complete
MELILLVCLGPKKHNSAAHTRTETQIKDASIAGIMLAQIGIGAVHAGTPESIYRLSNIQ